MANGKNEALIAQLRCFIAYKECGSVSEACKQCGISRNTFYRWLKEFTQAYPAQSTESVPAVTTGFTFTLHSTATTEPQHFKRGFFAIKAAVPLVVGLISSAALLALLVLTKAQASSWSPTLLVNTESFQVIDEGDSTTDVEIQFGDTLSRTLAYDRGNARFSFDDDVFIDGALNTSGSILVNNDLSGDAQLVFGSSLGNQTITLPEGDSTLRFSSGASFNGSISGSSLTISSLQNCDTLDTTASGQIICGTDGVSSATNLYVDELGDTMEGRLIVDIDTYTGALLQPDDGSVSANLVLWLDADQIIGLSDGDPVATWTDSSGNGNTVIQITPGNQPEYVTNAIGLYPAVRFDGTDDYLRDATASYNARTVFIVHRISSADQPNTDLAQLWGNYGDGVQVAPDPRQTEGFFSFDGGGSAQARCGTNGDSYGSVFANGIACDWNYDTSQILATEFTANQALTSTSIATLFPSFTVGTHQYGGDIAEIIVYDRVLTGSERDGIETYLSAKYDIALDGTTEALNAPDTVAVQIESESTSGPAIQIDIQGDSDSPHLAFGSGGTIDTNLYRSAANVLRTDDSFTVAGTFSGTQINGFGLTDCDADNAKLQWDSALQRFVCTTKAGNENMFVARSTDGANFNANPRLITWEAEDIEDAAHFAHTANASNITLVSTGWYRVSYLISWDQSAQNNRVGMRCYLTDGGVLMPGTESYGYSRDDTQVSRGSCSHTFVFQNTVASNIVDLRADLGLNDADYNDTNANIVERESVSIVLEYLGP